MWQADRQQWKIAPMDSSATPYHATTPQTQPQPQTQNSKTPIWHCHVTALQISIAGTAVSLRDKF